MESFLRRGAFNFFYYFIKINIRGLPFSNTKEYVKN